MIKRIVIAGIFILSASAHSAHAQNLIISAEQVKGLLDGAGKLLLIDARSRDEYREGHIPGALNIPPERVQAERRRLPKDKSATIIFYCRGVG